MDFQYFSNAVSDANPGYVNFVLKCRASHHSVTEHRRNFRADPSPIA